MQTIRCKSTIAQSLRYFVLATVAIGFALVGITPANIAFGQCGSHLQHYVKTENPTQIGSKLVANPQFASQNHRLPCNSPACRSAPAKSIPSPMVAPSSLRQPITTASPLSMLEIARPAVSLSRFSMHSGWRMAGFLDSVDRPPIALNA